MAFVQRLLNVSFQLSQGNFTTSGSSTTMVSGLRSSARIVSAGGFAQPECQMQIFGMKLSTMKQIATLGIKYESNEVQRNKMTVQAGDLVSGLNTVFTGTIINAYIDFTGMPDVSLNLYAVGLGGDATRKASSNSYNGATDAGSILSTLAGQMGYPLINNGLSVSLNSPYFWGSPFVQFIQCLEAANADYDFSGGQLSVWPKSGSNGTTVTLVSPETGMVGYPTFEPHGIAVKTLYNPPIRVGTLIQVRSAAIPTALENPLVSSTQFPADGTWKVYKIDHALDSQMPHGEWFSMLWRISPQSPAFSSLTGQSSP